MPSPHNLRVATNKDQSLLSLVSGFWQHLVDGRVATALLDAHPRFEWLGKELGSDETQQKLCRLLENKSLCRVRLVPPVMLASCRRSRANGDRDLTGGEWGDQHVAVAVDVVGANRTVTFGTVVEPHQKSWRVVRVFDPMPLANAIRNLCTTAATQIASRQDSAVPCSQ
ncbi:MAG: hypothetical protein A2289_16670 [Deltaproteobacteria bacterium RIFOXYA12_FULL_58_15]|nr:MAG: hypothetical protein A2289_16670 [Deltaproteobacteria bacterium RIFOXYA12_FULL_58_15]